ncbi:SGNH/GDSL hydrolase family protein [Massilia terrae]|uniref:GDSL-type esterase/lipase family protein n=1 Tax=Massilia terrae TaxID=1811224 RepID=A0ABT2D3Y2_9BURK|nr:GDSL-type esterase/lipase family protein [Massilia terrae]MCS0660038.1 GDSL-type esterase/lipase family protein [Massilia terrae]
MQDKFHSISTPLTSEFIHGAVEIEQTRAGLLPHRLPAWARAQCPDWQLEMAESQPSGIRLIFQTTASYVYLVTLPTKRVYAYMSPRPDGVYDLLVDGQLTLQVSVSGGNVMTIDMAAGTQTVVAGAPQIIQFDNLPPGSKTVEIWLPYDETTELKALHSDAPIFPVAAPPKRRWLHHGSSISHGSNAASPTGIWPVIAAQRAGLELVNLGFGGNALLDPFTARTMRDLPADLISVKLGINLVNKDVMRLRAFGPAVHGFLDTIREGHPTTPLLVISPIYCPIHEDAPGPTMVDTGQLRKGKLVFRASGNANEVGQGKLTLRVIRKELEAIVQQRSAKDPNIHYLDGTALYGQDDNASLPLPDELHPDAAAHQLIGERFADLAFAGSSFGKQR